ncbi:MAG: hypothetical protein CMD58_00285 [Gammaproteobacteria bacterium]|nr:hypothetical protein [Gammaproteobacteria bacterium]
MNKNILLIGASGFLGRELFNNLIDGNNKITLIARKKIDINVENVKQIIINFKDLDTLKNLPKFDETYITIGSRLKTYELLYIKKKNRARFRQIDYEYIKKIANLVLNAGADKISFISAIGANVESNNYYLKVKGEVEQTISNLGFKKIIIAQPGHLLGSKQKFKFDVWIFELLSLLSGVFMIGTLSKFKSIHISKVSKSLIEAMRSENNGIKILRYKDFKDF